MRILISSESFYPYISGVSVSTLNLATYLSGNGHEVAVVAPSPHRKMYRERLGKGFVVWHIGSLPNPFRKNHRLTVYPWRQMRAVVSYWMPAIVHLQDPNPTSWALLRAAKSYDLPVVISHHFTLDYILAYLEFLKPVHPYVRKGLSTAVSTFYSTADYIICPSETLKNELLATGLDTPVASVSNGIDWHRFHDAEVPEGFKANLGLPDVPLILYVGRIDPDKDLETLIKAIPFIIQKNNVHFVLCGGGKMLPHLIRMVEDLDIDSHVTFIGPLDYASEDLPRIYKTSSMFVIPSQIETQSLVTLEAMAAGLPVVAARSGALPELVAHGENGLLFDPGNPDNLADHINYLLSKTELMKDMGRKSMEKARPHDLNNVLWQVQEIYYHVLENYSSFNSRYSS